VLKEKKYEAFGNLIWAEGTHDDNREFTSKEKDPTGFHYFGARYYWANLGRFGSPDPHTLMPENLKLENPQELNPYVYCVNNPNRYIDPNGEFMIVVEYNRSAQYGSKALVWNGLLPDGIFDMKTRADMPGTNAAVSSGIYNYEVGTHKGSYFAEHKALIINENKSVPIEEKNINPKSNYFGEKLADGIHSHAGSRQDNEGPSGSQGCWTVPVVKGDEKYKKDDPSTWTNYKEYISSFKEGSEGKAILTRLPDWLFFWRD
jgi:RHS repeat-associated protein